MAEKLHISENFEALCTERVSLTFGHEPVEYRINSGRLDVKKIFFRSQLIVKKFYPKRFNGIKLGEVMEKSAMRNAKCRK